MKIHNNVESFIENIMDIIGKEYLLTLHNEVNKNSDLKEKCPSVITNPDIITIYLGETHIGIEFEGVEKGGYSDDSSKIKIRTLDYIDSKNSLFDEILGFSFGTDGISIPLPEFTENLKFPTVKGMEKLLDLKWNFDAEDFITIFGKSFPLIEKGTNYRIVNSTFYDEEEGSLKVRHIKWLDLISVESKENAEGNIEFLFNLPYTKEQAKKDILYNFNLPNGYKLEKLKKLNNFIEFYGNKDNSETQITSFLAKEENKFILTMNFGGQDIFSELVCEWQSEEKDDIKPDFFLLRPDGYCDIIEFKLPYIKSNGVVGKNNRETFSAEINSYISQTRVYREYFDDPNNRKWVKEKYDLDFYKPKRILVVGNRKDFSIEDWKEIKSDFHDLEILTYDDIKDGTIAQLYRK